MVLFDIEKNRTNAAGIECMVYMGLALRGYYTPLSMVNMGLALR